jgi:hypothetical protein
VEGNHQGCPRLPSPVLAVVQKPSLKRARKVAEGKNREKGKTIEKKSNPCKNAIALASTEERRGVDRRMARLKCLKEKKYPFRNMKWKPASRMANPA